MHKSTLRGFCIRLKLCEQSLQIPISMSIKPVQVNVNELAMGMFVSGLDRPWIQTPFPIQGFWVRSALDIENLRAYCDYVYIDVTKGRSASQGKALPIPRVHKGTAPAPTKPKANQTARATVEPVGHSSRQRIGRVPLKVNYGVFDFPLSLKEEDSYGVQAAA